MIDIMLLTHYSARVRMQDASVWRCEHDLCRKLIFNCTEECTWSRNAEGENEESICIGGAAVLQCCVHPCSAVTSTTQQYGWTWGWGSRGVPYNLFIKEGILMISRYDMCYTINHGKSQSRKLAAPTLRKEKKVANIFEPCSQKV